MRSLQVSCIAEKFREGGMFRTGSTLVPRAWDLCTVVPRSRATVASRVAEGREPFARRKTGESGKRPDVVGFLTGHPCALLDTIPRRDRVSPCGCLPRRHHVKETGSFSSGNGYSRLLDGREDRVEYRSFRNDDDCGERTGSGTAAATEEEQRQLSLGVATRRQAKLGTRCLAQVLR